jgi:2-polyprenyl-3-methyl-5-hydroxy-6-metoxy-1,4-benzoquinol methylase
MLSADQVASPEYRRLLQQRYSQPGWGGSGYHHWLVAAEYAYELGAQSILDYGCGRGSFKVALLDNVETFTDVREYDPGIVGKDTLPEPADLVVCTDVLEHIEPVLLTNVLAHIKSLARLGAFLIIATNRAKETLPDGRNAHLIQQPAPWWMEQLRQAGLKVDHFEVRKGVYVWVKQ